MELNFNPLALTIRDLSGSGTTCLIAFEDGAGNPLPVTDAAGVLWDSVSVAVPASTTWGISWALLNQVKPDGTNAITSLPTGAVCVRVSATVGASPANATCSVNFGGTIDGSAGTSTTGFAAGYGASANTPTRLYVGSQAEFGRARR